MDTTLDPIQLGIFSHRFMSIAEQMGRALQRTSISTNIKERLDFSCALFGMHTRQFGPLPAPGSGLAYQTCWLWLWTAFLLAPTPHFSV